MHYLVTGANRGIGLELVRQLLARKQRVTATARQPERAEALQQLLGDFGDALRIVTLDVGNDASIAALATTLGSQPLDVLINNAGVGSNDNLMSFSREQALAIYATNAVSPMLVTRALLPALRAATSAKVVNISSLMGSVADNTSSGSHAYRMSKAALNMATKCLAIDLARDGVVVAAMHPGWVKTDMGGKRAPIEVEDSAKGILKVVDGLDAKAAGALIDFTGRTLPF